MLAHLCVRCPPSGAVVGAVFKASVPACPTHGGASVGNYDFERGSERVWACEASRFRARDLLRRLLVSTYRLHKEVMGSSSDYPSTLRFSSRSLFHGLGLPPEPSSMHKSMGSSQGF